MGLLSEFSAIDGTVPPNARSGSRIHVSPLTVCSWFVNKKKNLRLDGSISIWNLLPGRRPHNYVDKLSWRFAQAGRVSLHSARSLLGSAQAWNQTSPEAMAGEQLSEWITNLEIRDCETDNDPLLLNCHWFDSYENRGLCFEETSVIAVGDVCKGFGKIPTSGLRCDHL